MDLNQILAHSDLVVALLAALSASFACLVVFWPFFAPDTLGRRMRQVVDEAERIRMRERARLHGGAAALRVEPRKLFKDVVERLGLGKNFEDGSMVRRLQMAGYRGEAPVTAYLALRVLMPAGGFGLSVLYLFLLELDVSVLLQAAGAVAVGGLCFYLPGVWVTNTIHKRQEAIGRAWPDALDLLLICVESGMSIESALRRVATEVAAESAELAEELALATAEMAYLADRRKAFENLAARTGVESVRAAMTTLLQADRHGTSLGQSLRVLAQESRMARMNAAEKRAAGLAPKLTVPMILFFLPVLFGVILGPAIIQVFNMP